MKTWHYIAIGAFALLMSFFIGRFSKKCPTADTSVLERETELLKETIRQKDLEYEELKKIDSVLAARLAQKIDTVYLEKKKKLIEKIRSDEMDSVAYWNAVGHNAARARRFY